MTRQDLLANLKRYAQVAWLPVVLTILLVVEVYLFNRWLNIIPSFYFFRRTAANVSLGAFIFGSAIFFRRKSSRYMWLVTASVFVALVCISQYLYYEYSGGFLQASALSYAGQTGELAGTIKALLTWKLLLFISPLAVITAGYFVMKTQQAAAHISGFKEKSIAALILVTLVCSGYGVLLELEKHDWGDTSRLFGRIYDVATLEGKIGIVNYYLEDLVKYALLPHSATPQDTALVQSFAKAQVQPVPQPPAKGGDFGELKGRNLIFLQIESLENWVIGYKINGQLVAPNLTALATQGKYFPNYYSQIGPGNTADAEFSTLNSLYPLPDEVAFITYAQHQYTALPSLLDSNGYTTAAMHGDVATFWNRSNAYPSMGYQKIISQQDYTIPRPIGFDNLGDSDFFQQSLPKVQALKQPFMATLITLSTHTPFELPQDLQTLSIPSNTTLTPTQQQYLETVHYSDAAIGSFIAGLKADGLYDNSLLAIYGDHEAFIGTPDSQTNHVPLILLAPGAENFSGTDTTPGSHLDLYPTVVDLLGITPPKSILGQDLLTTKTPVVTQRVLGTGAIKFIISSTLRYNGSADGVFGNGTCQSWPAGASLPVSNCQALYNQQLETTEVSDTVVRYNLVNSLNP